MDNYLKATKYLDFEHENIQNLVSEFKSEKLTDKEKAIGLYLKIRDLKKYYAYDIGMSDYHYTASEIVSSKTGQCISKSILLASCFRAVNIPSRLRYAKVKNHMAVEKMLAGLGSDVIAPHGMVDVYLDDKWLKLSPAFDAKTCEENKVDPLEFDGENHSIFQQHNKEGDLFMEYVEDYGHYDDVPIDRLFEIFIETYPNLFDKVFNPESNS